MVYDLSFNKKVVLFYEIFRLDATLFVSNKNNF